MILIDINRPIYSAEFRNDYDIYVSEVEKLNSLFLAKHGAPNYIEGPLILASIVCQIEPSLRTHFSFTSTGKKRKLIVWNLERKGIHGIELAKAIEGFGSLTAEEKKEKVAMCTHPAPLDNKITFDAAIQKLEAHTRSLCTEYNQSVIFASVSNDMRTPYRSRSFCSSYISQMFFESESLSSEIEFSDRFQKYVDANSYKFRNRQEIVRVEVAQEVEISQTKKRKRKADEKKHKAKAYLRKELRTELGKQLNGITIGDFPWTSFFNGGYKNLELKGYHFGKNFLDDLSPKDLSLLVDSWKNGSLSIVKKN